MPVLLELISAERIQQLAEDNLNLKMALYGENAEFELIRLLNSILGVVGAKKILQNQSNGNNPDIFLYYLDIPIIIECKNLGFKSVKRTGDKWKGRTANIRFKDKRERTFPDGTTWNSTHCSIYHFDILAVCTVVATDRWDFIYALTTTLPRLKNNTHTEHQKSQLLPCSVPVDSDSTIFTSDIASLLHQIYIKKTQV